jgi:glycosyltransferase involved in cell wall biosynthesis
MPLKNHFKIIVPSYNNEKWISSCLKSIMLQNYDNYQCIVTDDCSSDKSVEISMELTKDDSRFILINNEQKKLALRNIYESIELSKPDDNDIIITLDGDDWFATKNTLEILNNLYNKENCLMTYGSYIEYPSLQRGKFSRKIPESVVENNAFRESEWMSSHLRTFKYKLWKDIKKEDFLKEDGNFSDGAWDMIFMFPMLEMSKHRSCYVEEVLHVYNRSNPLNEDKVNHQKILMSEQRIRKMPKYNEVKYDN